MQGLAMPNQCCLAVRFWGDILRQETTTVHDPNTVPYMWLLKPE